MHKPISKRGIAAWMIVALLFVILQTFSVALEAERPCPEPLNMTAAYVANNSTWPLLDAMSTRSATELLAAKPGNGRIIATRDALLYLLCLSSHGYTYRAVGRRYRQTDAHSKHVSILALSLGGNSPPKACA